VSDRTCPHMWKTAAVEDGRLEGGDAVSFELHATRCVNCRAERKAIVDAEAAVRAVPFQELSPLSHARQRAALLAQANDRFIRPPPRRWRPWGLALLGAAGAAAAAVFVVGRVPTLATAVQDAPLGAPRCDVVANERALWRTQVEGTMTRVDVADGEATLVVGPIVGAQRAVIRLPDGEIEASTSQIAVEVALGRTRSVKVEAGRVLLRPQDEEPVALSAGDVWPRRTATSATHLSQRDPALEPPGPTAANGAYGPPRSATPPARGSNPTAGMRRTQLASAAFDEAISSFVHASYGQADRELRDFIAAFPEDSRCEDAAFLSTVTRWRMGDAAGARDRAASYLKAYPQGLRRAEAQQIMDAGR
jgi:hypothetical protein